MRIIKLITAALIIFLGTTSAHALSVTLANTKLSIVNGAAFVDLGATINLAQYPTGTQVQICSVTNSTQCVSGYIKAAGSAESYGSELLGNTAFDNTTGVGTTNSSVASVAGGQSGNALQVTATTTYGLGTINATSASGRLLYLTYYQKNGTGGTPTAEIVQNGSPWGVYVAKYTSSAGAFTKYSMYTLVDMTNVQVDLGLTSASANNTVLYDTVSCKQVTAPGSSGVTITSTNNGTTYNWATNNFSTTSSFNDASGYTYTITLNAAAVPTFNFGTGNYNKTVSVTPSTSTSGATICYTTDGSTPTATVAGTCDQNTYSTPIGINTTGTVLTSLATKSGITNSATATATYTIGKYIAAWGDSLTLGNQDGSGTTYPSVLTTLTGTTAYNGGVGGQTSTQIASRMLAAPQYDGYVNLIWSGRNNYASQATILSDVASMVAASTGQYLVLSIINQNTANEWTGSYPTYPDYNQIVGVNAALAAAYPSNYLDVRSALVAAYNPNNAEDVIDHSNDMVPTSLRATWNNSGTLTNSIGASGYASFVFTSSYGNLYSGCTLTIDNEKMWVALSGPTGGGPYTYTVTYATRGYAGTTAATHTAGANMVSIVDPLHLNAAGYTFVANTVKNKLASMNIFPEYPTTYYMATAGNDSNDGYTLPWKTIAKVNNYTTLKAGDSILLNRGDTWREQLTVPSSGSAGSPIVFGAYGSGANPMINGADLVTGSWSAASGSWATTGSWNTLSTNGSGSEADTRQFWAANTFSTSGTQVRFTIKSQAGGNFAISGSGVGTRSGTSTSFTGTPTRVTWSTAGGDCTATGGGNGITIAAGKSCVSDAITFNFDKTTAMGFSWHSSAMWATYTGSATGATAYWAGSGDSSMTQAGPSVGNNMDSVCYISKVEVITPLTNVWQIAWTASTPTEVYFNNSTAGTKQSSTGALAAQYDWYWASNVLYTYAASEPGALYTSIEAEGRTNNIVNTKDYITIQDMAFMKTNRASILNTSTNTTTVQRCSFSDINGSTFLAAGYAGVYFRKCQNGYVGYSTFGPRMNLDGVTIVNDTASASDNFIIEHNTFNGLSAHAIYAGDHATWPLSGNITNLVVRYNSMTNTCTNYALEGSALYIPTGSSYSVVAPQIYYNLIYGNNTDGIQITNGGVRATGAKIDNNTITGNGILATGNCMDLSIDNSYIRNNICLNNNVHGDSTYELVFNKTSGGGYVSTINNNLWYKSGQTSIMSLLGSGYTFSGWQGQGYDAAGLSVDPKFVSTSDFHLTSASPAKGAGVAISGLTLDFSGKTVKSPPSMGAYEFWGGNTLLRRFLAQQAGDPLPISGTFFTLLPSASDRVLLPSSTDRMLVVY